MDSWSGDYSVLFSAQVKPECIDAFKAETKKLAEGSRQEEGCLRYEILQNEKDATKFTIFEVYKTPNDLKIHQTKPHFLAFSSIVNDLLQGESDLQLFYVQ